MGSQGEDDPHSEPPWLRQAASTPTGEGPGAALQDMAHAPTQASVPPDPPRLPRAGDLVGGKYRVEQMVGRGGMGAVYRARHELMDAPVALKWLVPELCENADVRERFLQEAKVAARLRHPNVVHVHDVGVESGALYMVMELLEGESFEALIERGDIPIPDMLQILVQAMYGVAAAHAQGVVHRDIKPDNLFVTPDATQPSGMRAKVLDFGISKVTADRQRETGITRSGVTMGTPAYMSMEQMNGAKDVDARADVYSFGVLMYRALTGELPFKGDTFGAVAVALATATPPAPKQLRPDLPRALNDAVLKAMARNRDERFASLDEMLDTLRSLATADGYLGQMTHPSTSPPSLTPPGGREQVRAITAPAAAIEGSPPERGVRWAVLALLGLLSALIAAWFAGAFAPPFIETNVEELPVQEREEPASAAVTVSRSASSPMRTLEAEPREITEDASPPATAEDDVSEQTEPSPPAAPNAPSAVARRKSKPPVSARTASKSAASSVAPAVPPAPETVPVPKAALADAVPEPAPEPVAVPVAEPPPAAEPSPAVPARTHRSGGVSAAEF